MTSADSPDDRVTATRARELLAGLEKLPSYDGVVFRGRTVGGVPANGTVTVSTALVAASRDVRVATDNLAHQWCYAIISSQGRGLESVSQRPQEREVVFLPSSMFLVLESWRHADVGVTVVEQLDPSLEPGTPPTHTLEQVRGHVVAEITAARGRADVEDVTPGKFLGDLS